MPLASGLVLRLALSGGVTGLLLGYGRTGAAAVVVGVGVERGIAAFVSAPPAVLATGEGRRAWRGDPVAVI